MTGLGHNKPPEMLELAKDVTRQISEWFAENPVVTSEEEARKIKLHIDRAKLCLKDLEVERDREVRPLNERVSQINMEHRNVRRPLGTVLNAMLEVSEAYLKAEEDRRNEAAVEASLRADEARERVLALEAAERDGIDNAREGEVGINIASLSEQTDAAFSEYAVAERAAIRARGETRVKLAGGIRRALSLKGKETLDVVDPQAALQDMGLVENVRLALLTAARAFRRMHNRLPKGISSTTERHVK